MPSAVLLWHMSRVRDANPVFKRVATCIHEQKVMCVDYEIFNVLEKEVCPFPLLKAPPD